MSSTGAECVSRADRQVVDAGLGDGPGAVQRQPAGRLELGPAGDELDGMRAGRRASCCRAGGSVAPASSASSTCSTVSHSTSTSTSGNSSRTARTPRPTPPAASDVVVLDERRVGEPHAVVGAAAAAHGVLLQRPQARAGLAGVEDARSVPSTSSTQRRVTVATPDRWQSRFSAVRSAVSNARTSARADSRTSPAATASPSCTCWLTTTESSVDDFQHGTHDRQAGDDAGRARGEVGDASRSNGHRREAGDVDAVAEVLGERDLHQPLDRRPGRRPTSAQRLRRRCVSRLTAPTSSISNRPAAAAASVHQADLPALVVALGEVVAPVAAARLLRDAPPRSRALTRR